MNYSIESKYPDYFLGMSQFKNGNHYEAIKNFSSAVNTHPYCITAYFHRARSYINLKQYENALSDFNRALTIAINNQDRTDLRENYYIENYDILMDRGLAHSSLGEYQKALQDYQTARQEIIATGDPSGQELLPQLDMLTMSCQAQISNNRQPPAFNEPSSYNPKQVNEPSAHTYKRDEKPSSDGCLIFVFRSFSLFYIIGSFFFLVNGGFMAALIPIMCLAILFVIYKVLSII